MRAVTFHAPGQVALEDRPEPELSERTDAVVRIDATGVCGSDLHIYRGRVRIEPGFTIGHEFVGKVVAAGDAVTRVSPGDRVLGCFHTACGTCFFCLRGAYQKCERARTFGHGAALGSLQGTQAEQALVPMANMTLRKVPDQLSDEIALFAGDVMGTAYHAIAAGEVRPGDSVAVLGLGPVGLSAVQVALAAGAGPVIAIDTVEARLGVARALGATPVHLTHENPRDAVLGATDGRGVDAAIDAVGHPDALELAIRLARNAGNVVAVGVYAERCELHMGLVWIKGLTLRSGQANVIGHVDRVLGMLAAGTLDPSPLITHRMPLDEAPRAYEVYDRREALKIVLTP
ncbi:MAG: alcohol dehydrogenase catalytic domain-containing protein [Solirubrobacterales bacterium]|nr:alcohol dehydrogenase catalytic domain-containing protein [Solirubrobacterales bacterium]MBV9422253.1 alcohol dehydrogenase catalytic domain-containing protein [Solirubrobacterales bacterium]MBV9797219.1 alcohol dehydrogenase catalytic domain-containing protein [Solirubrobacterales bacterium]